MLEATKDYVKLEDEMLCAGDMEPDGEGDDDCRKLLEKAHQLSLMEIEVNKQRERVRGFASDLADLENPDIHAEFQKLDTMCAQWTQLEYEHALLKQQIIGRIQKRGA